MQRLSGAVDLTPEETGGAYGGPERSGLVEPICCQLQDFLELADHRTEVAQEVGHLDLLGGLRQ
ncbi:hypothetical protein [Kitasatospora sp. MBT63]|uniref:hypothetical protein n=1 Tax=Kitasatospora sp. MBT63 TaxID=1444768 RepID=UPI0011EA6186|nr:hypothetical protein [Kitasatospora sp. MBT63]